MARTKPRTKKFDMSTAPRQPSTDRYCVRCRRDIAPGQDARMVHLIDGGCRILHPEDEHLYRPDSGDVGLRPVGPSCAKMIGLAWSVPDSTLPPTDAPAYVGPDAECTECGEMYFSGDGPRFNIAVCRKCFTSGTTGPLGVVD